MSYPPPSGGWQDPYAPGPQSGPPADPTLAAPIPSQPTSADPYAGYKFESPQPTVDPYGAGGYPPAAYPPGYQVAPPQNGLAIAAMIVSIVGALGLCGYGLGGYIGLVGAILGHVSRKQIRERGESGEGFATAGIIVGWITTVIAVLATIAIVIFFVWIANQDTSSYDSTGY
ncbi:DUF4190 domain-containing protein [Micromonospora sp. R77]|uniref:DUF4190 domain-containing protein n=1 Tax=Micromonospora sp. R77 TaxID=2925836 RepID=UPI001F60E7B3|nr:DUF4190 domain-containing protein [Micromonospora sp. R77]MCI4064120.1 DUF4190 domain-containing protein [Micromonospora sp. R77]